ncbi:MAG: hypothetical protein GXO39_00865 [Thermotogae bacterium]|nr:hypothetical protein [Thermotogota bacterium]
MMGLIIALHSLDRDAHWVPPETLDLWGKRKTEIAPVNSTFIGTHRTPLTVEFIGPRPMFNEPWSDGTVAGRMVAILPHPTDPNIVYVAAASGGVWKSTDGGLTWTPLTDHLPTTVSGALAFDPTDPDIVYYGTGEMHYCLDCFPGDGLFRSTDGGITWTKIATTSQVGSYISRILVNPTDPNIIFVAGNSGLARSLDGGSSWSFVYSPTDVNSVVMRSDAPNVLFMGVYGEGVFVSSDNGNTWNLITSLPTSDSGIKRVELAISPSNPDVIYASFTGTSSELYGLYKSTDGGSTWTRLDAPDYLYPQGWYDHAIIVHPYNPDIVFAGGVFPYSSSRYGIVRTLDGGLTWEDVTDRDSLGIVHPDIHFFAFGPDTTLYVACDGGIWKSRDLGNSWENLNEGLGALQFYTVSVNPRYSGLITGGTQDNGAALYFDGWGIGWENVAGGDGGPTVWRTDSTEYFFTTYIRMSNLTRKYWSWSDLSVHYDAYIGGPWSGVDRASWANGPFVADPTGSSATLYLGTYRIWKSTDGGLNWSSMTGDLTDGTGVLLSLAVSQSNDTLYVGTSNALVKVSFDGGSTWMDRTPSGLYGWEDFTDVWVNPNDASEVYTSAKRGSGTRIFHSTDAGSTWEDLTGDLPNVTVYSLAIDFRPTPHHIFVGAYDGLYYSTDGGVTYTKEIGIPSTPVYDLVVDTLSGNLIVATHGRGVWRVSLPVATSKREVPSAVRRSFVLVGKTLLVAGEGKLYDVSGRKVGEGSERWKVSLKPGVYMLKQGEKIHRIIVK